MGYRRQLTEKEQLTRAGLVLVFIVVVFGLLRLGVFNGMATYMVRSSFDTMQAEMERQQNQPRTIVLKTGERMRVKRVLDQGKYWSYVALDGRNVGVYKKDDVEQIIDESAKP